VQKRAMPKVSCAVILAVRNEAVHIGRMLDDYIEQGINAVVIDNGSTDETLVICEKFLGRGLLAIEHQPWHGVFDLSAQLAAKEAVVAKLPHEWVIHADADEWLQSPVEGESLLEGIARFSAEGFNVVNFEEFVFIPTAEVDVTHDDYRQEILHYYYFAPGKNRRMLAWKRADGLSNLASGGHRLTGGDIRLAPETFILRHYLVLSYQHAVAKYVGKIFSDEDLERGWHGNRRNLSADRLLLPDAEVLKRLPDWQSKQFDRTSPVARHYWQW